VARVEALGDQLVRELGFRGSQRLGGGSRRWRVDSDGRGEQAVDDDVGVAFFLGFGEK